jgi:hypothetical protein
MVMNKRGEGGAIFLFMMACVFFFLGINLAYPVVQTVGESMLQLDCHADYLTNSTLDNQTKIYCTGIDVFSFVFILLCFGLGALLLKSGFGS